MNQITAWALYSVGVIMGSIAGFYGGDMSVGFSILGGGFVLAAAISAMSQL